MSNPFTDQHTFEIDPGTTVGPVSLTISDLERSVVFYRDYLGFNVIERHGDSAALGADVDIPLLYLTELPGVRPKPRRTTGLYHFAVLVPSRVDLGRSLRRLVELNYPLTGGSDHLVSEALYLDDPDGNGIEIYRDRPRAEWKYDHGMVRMAVDPLDLRSLLAEATDTPTDGGLAPQTTIGHIHLHIAHLDTAKAFYHDLLGFNVTADTLPGALFVSAGGYHHHIGLNTWVGVGAPPPPADAVGLRVFTVALADEGALARVVVRVEEAGVAMETTEDGVVVHDPSGNRLRLAVRAD